VRWGGCEQSKVRREEKRKRRGSGEERERGGESGGGRESNDTRVHAHAQRSHSDIREHTGDICAGTYTHTYTHSASTSAWRLNPPYLQFNLSFRRYAYMYICVYVGREGRRGEERGGEGYDQ